MTNQLKMTLIEDNPADVILMEEVLKDSGVFYSLRIIEDGEEAIRYAEAIDKLPANLRPDLVLLDLNLPKHSGFEVLNAIRSYDSLRSLPVVILTTSENPVDKQIALEQRATCFINKPADWETLSRILEVVQVAWFSIGMENGSEKEIENAYKAGNENTKQKALLIEDNPTDTFYMMEVLKRSNFELYDVEAVEDLASAIRALARERFDVILTDLGLPDAEGLKVISALTPYTDTTPIIILTGLNDEETAAQAVRCGAQDYLVKGKVDTDSLLRSIRYAVMRKQADSLAKQTITLENELLQEILAHAPISIARFNSKLQLSSCNSVFYKKLGREPKDLLGKSMCELLPQINAQNWLDIVGRGIPFNEANCTITNKTDLSEFVWDLTAWPIQTRDMTPKGGLVVALDITERKTLEQQKEDFVAALAHDIKNPLVGADRLLNLISAGTLGKLGEEHERVITLLRESNSNVLSMLHNLLDVYRYEIGAVSLHFSEIDLRHPLMAAISSVTLLGTEKGITVDVKLAENLEMIVADPVAMQRLFANLLHNAFKFSRQGGKVIVEARPSQFGAEIEISDQGTGMSLDEQKYLFKRFGTGITKQIKRGSGTGLGLYVCKQIVDAMKGTITCQSEPGEGTRFIINLRTAKTWEEPTY